MSVGYHGEPGRAVGCGAHAMTEPMKKPDVVKRVVLVEAGQTVDKNQALVRLG